VPGGGLSPDGDRWIACKPGFFLPVKVLGRVFRGKFLERLRASHAAGALTFQGSLSHLAAPAAFTSAIKPTYESDWVVYAKPPFGGPEQVLKYLARYTHRVAISNHRLRRMEDGKVTFAYKDYAHGNRPRTMTLSAIEFLRRFLLHVLPRGFVRIRHHGFLANRCRKEKLLRCRELLGVETEDPEVALVREGDEETPDNDGEETTRACPSCEEGRMLRLFELSPEQACARERDSPMVLDTS